MTSYCGPPPVPAEAMLAWNLDPALLAIFAASAALASRAGSPRLAFAGVGVLALAFLSPLCAISVALFSARALPHVLLVAVSAPLLALAFPARRPHALGISFVAATTTLWLWHVPSFYDSALASTPVYWLMQSSLLTSAIWFWRCLFAAPPVAATSATIAAMAQMGMLGALLTFAPSLLYAAHAGTTVAWGLPALVDQQLAGLVMWVPGIIPYAIALGIVARRGWTQAMTAP